MLDLGLDVDDRSHVHCSGSFGLRVEQRYDLWVAAFRGGTSAATPVPRTRLGTGIALVVARGRDRRRGRHHDGSSSTGGARTTTPTAAADHAARPRRRRPGRPDRTTTTTHDAARSRRDFTLTHVTTINGHISPKSVDATGTGLVFAQNMMYRHTMTVYDARTARS